MKIETDEFGEYLRIDGEEFESSGESEFEVVASRLRHATLSDIPRGISVILCDRVIGAKDLYARNPHCRFEHTKEGILVGHGETAFVLEGENIESAIRQEYLRIALANGKSALAPLSRDGRLVALTESVYDEITYLNYSLQLPDQPVLEAESFMEAIEERIHRGLERPLLFICHASEDKSFVERLVSELDRRALYAWFDKREILVGDSIVARINDALSEARYVVTILSSRSVLKPWVTRELNSSLMRQLADEGVTILPVLINDCEIPALLADIKYADFRVSFEEGLAALLAAVRRREETLV